MSLHRDPVCAVGENGRDRKGDLEHTGAVDVRLGGCAVNLRPRQAAAILIDQDVKVVRRARP